ncbi:N-6 DNA methylase [Patescibacteria group bacterium]|nr:N-6 DNA methylase [Patescibacteria group bacterium]
MNFAENETSEKLRGGYYTPLNLATFLARWIKEVHPKSILEPSCGDGVFFEALNKVGSFRRSAITGIEFNSKEASKARQRIQNGFDNAKIHSTDFLDWSLKALKNKNIRFDAVIGNPPFIRYQYLPEIFKTHSEEIFKTLDLPFTKHTNAWVPFILASFALLKPGGRLAMVIPAEIIHIIYAQSTRNFLGKECKRLVIIDPQEIWFDNTLQGAVLLLAEKRSSETQLAGGVGIYPVKNREFVNLDPGKVFAAPKPINGRTVMGKWTYALLEPAMRVLLDEVSEHTEVHRFKEIADVDVGIVTGANDYFLVSDEVIDEYGLSDWAHPMFGRSDHCPGVIYDKKQHSENKLAGKPTNFIWFPKEEVFKNEGVKRYIQYGEKRKLQTRYKCSVRTPWYSVPSVYATNIGMLKRAHNIPRLVFNKMEALTTDTAYRISSSTVKPETLVSNFVNSLTALSAELEGRHYGGGVLELVPSEIEKLLIPLPNDVHGNLRVLDKEIRSLPIEQVLANQDKRILGALGLSRKKREQLFKAWEGLRNRRQRIDAIA